jgi:hypothetical protein
MTTLICFLKSIPDVIWSGLIASVLTLSGVLISNWSNTSRLRLQLRHDSDQKATERTAALRRDVYLLATEELTKANSYLGSLAQIDLAKTNAVEGMQGFFAAAAKLQLVAEPKTALLVNQLVADYAEILLKIMASLLPLQSLRADIAICNDLYEQAQVEVKRILAEMAKFNESVQTDGAIFKALQRAFDFQQSQAQLYASERSEHWDNFNKLNVEFCRSLIPEMQRLGEIQIPVLVEIRRDLGLTGELDAFRAQMQANAERMKNQLENLLNAIQNG